MTGLTPKRPRLLIPDTSPLSLLAMGGATALDFLFVPGAEVWVTDMVQMEATREPDPEDDQRRGHRQTLANWFVRNSDRIRIMETDTGTDYGNAMVNWIVSGRNPDTKPRWKGRGEQSLLDILSAAETIIEDSDAVVLLVDDRKARAAIRQTEGLNLDILTTRSFIRMIEEHYGIEHATDIWSVILLAAGQNALGKSRAPSEPTEDPIHVRKPT